MCVLCGAFGGNDHWSDRAEPFSAGRTRRAEGLARVQAANAILGAFAMKLDDWQCTPCILATAPGRRELADPPPQVWAMAYGILGRPIDPLDPDLIARVVA